MSNGITARFVKRFPTGPEIRVTQLQVSAAGGITVLFGASGAGKTTLLRCLAGLEKPDAGIIRFGSETWFDAESRRWVPACARRVGFVPQEYALFPHLTVERNIAYGLSGLPKAEQHQRLETTLRWLGLAGLEKRLPAELSGGQQQRVALARAVVPRPRLLLLDEPLSALDAPTRLRLRTELRGLLAELGIPTILVTHDRTEALALGDELVVMDSGQVVQQGPVQEVFSRPANLTVAGIVAVETILEGQVTSAQAGLVTVAIGPTRLTALAGDLPPNTQRVYVCIRAEDV
ncbi:MAG TPA: ABC transporter ATP-binding protein, partial [Candidatus Sulfotelmatobacter sp.]|nr:ABC transporter ATP-binding protein [Candidatus Sulfotelmatobacter sp.]